MRRKDIQEMIGQELPERFLENEVVEEGILQTSRGMVKFHGPLDKEELIELEIDQGLQNFRSADAQYEALLSICELPRSLVFVACHGNLIIGYIAFHEPEFPRWAKAAKGELPELLELGGIEVSDNWWNEKIGKSMLKWTFTNYSFEDKIVISLETCYNWKSRDPSVSVWEYREMLKNVLGSVGLVPMATDEPEILEHPANMLTARIGKDVSPEAREKFEKLLKVSKYKQEFY